jgi:hypothetical protein
MAENPPTKYAAYPRQNLKVPGTADQLQALSHGHDGITWVMAAWIAMNGFLIFLAATYGLPAAIILELLGAVFLGLFSGRAVEQIGVGMGWSRSKTTTVRVLFGLSLFFCTIFGVLLLQTLANERMRKFGLKLGLMGIDKYRLARKVAELRALETLTLPQAPEARENP